jgi:hypothetical protein
MDWYDMRISVYAPINSVMECFASAVLIIIIIIIIIPSIITIIIIIIWNIWNILTYDTAKITLIWRPYATNTEHQQW